uniref:C2 calcium dependent domain containing 4A n=1 Tax=Scleropages formosus TaxID=113540 RepID=A0A8C9TAL9_SCLFO
MWVIEKIRTSAENKVSLEKTRKSSPCPNVITPDTIPEFCIPPKIPYQQELRSTNASKPTAPPLEIFHPRRDASARDLLRAHVIQVENVDEVLLDSRHSDEESTNADPQSQAALSLPHLAKAQTSYGFCTLLESPHTRRKESLFHSDPSSCSIPLAFPRSRSSSYPRLGGDNTSSTDSSPFGSPLLQRSPPKSSLFKALSREKLFSRNVKRTGLSRNNSLSTDEGSSTDNSPSVIRRSSDGSWELQVVKESLIPLGTGGSLRLSAEYSPENHRLRLRLISADGLYALSVDPKTIGCSVTISLLPGKVQKQRSSIIRKSRNPIFNEDFFFDAISEGDLYHWSVRFKVVNKMPTMKRDYTLGDCDVPLASILSL